MKKKTVSLLLLATLTAGLLEGCGIGGNAAGKSSGPEEANLDEIKKGGFTVAASCHDPQIVVGEDGTYKMFGSHMVGAGSDNLRDWNYFAEGVDEENPLFDGLFAGEFPAFSFVGKNTDDWYSVWAPDVSYNETMGKYVMYFCTTSSYIKSNICLATADHIEGPYTYVDTVLYSGFGKSDADQTNIYEVLGEGADISPYLEYGGYNNKEWPNCIDPATFTDENGRKWMVYGSWSGGIFLLELDPATGYPVHPQADEANQVDAYYGKRLLGGGHHAVEGPYIQYNKETGYYYLFLSYGELTREGGYQIRQFRSENPDGPYVDAAGNTLENQEDYFNYGLKMAGNYTFPSLNYTYMAPGGQSAFEQNGNYYLTYHQRFDNGTEYHEPRVHRMFTNQEGWFVMSPFAESGETLKEDGYEKTELAGTFYLVNHGTDISSKIREAEAYTFSADGTIKGEEQNGTFEVEKGTCYVTVTLGDKSYQGVIIEMKDEAGNDTLCISTSGDSNETIWGVHYRKSEE